MKLDTHAIRYLTADDWRVLTAVEQGSKNHELVPVTLIQNIAGLRGGSGVHKSISALAKVGLIAKVKNAKYDGYRLTYGGLDYLALHTHTLSSTLSSVGNQIGIGKESDIFIAASPTGRRLALKLHRLGRISFRTVKANRDYLRRGHAAGSWMHLSRLAAQKEHACMRVLYREGFPVPEPVAWSRHTVVMEFVDAFPLRMVEGVPEPGKLYAELMGIIVDLARRGLIHGDFNEFNILIKEEEEGDGRVKLRPVVIDFPQAVSTNHVNAEVYFDRDVACVKRYFERRFKYVSDEPGPFLKDSVKGIDRDARLDVEVEASGFSKKMARELERFVGGGDQNGADDEAVGTQGKVDEDENDDEDDEDDDDDDDDFEEDDVPDEGADGYRDDRPDDDTALADQLGSLAVKHPGALADYGFVPLDLSPEPQDASRTADKVRTQKKATGWAI